jgi:DNA-binding CsgD family transcriptional regulator
MDESASGLDQSSEKNQSTAASIVGFLGYSALFSWLISFFFYENSTLVFSETDSFFSTFAIPIFGLACAIAFLLGSALANLFKSIWSLHLLSGISVVFVILGIVIPAGLLHLIATAIGYVALSMVWSAFLSIQRKVLFYIGGAVVAGAVICALVAEMTQLGETVLVSLLPFLSLILFWVAASSIRVRWDYVTIKESRKRFRIPLSGELASYSTNLIIGLAVVCIATPTATMIHKNLIVAGVIGIAGLIHLIDLQQRQLLSETLLLKVFVLSIVPSLYFLPIASGVGMIVAGCLLLFFMVFHEIHSIGVMAELVRFNQLSVLYCSNLIRGKSFLSFIIGWGIGYVAFEIIQSVIARTTILSIVLFAVMALTTFVFRDNHPTESHEANIVISNNNRDNSGAWRTRIEVIAKQYQLSPRQTEVFRLLAKGRNAEYIQKQFFISKATAKAHIYSIYRKTGIHSHQDLIDLVEKQKAPPPAA